MKAHYLLAASLILLMDGSNSPEAQIIDTAVLSGNVTLMLKNAVWMPWKEKPVYQSVTLDLVCEQAQCQPDVWGYAPKYNQADHQGTVKVIGSDHLWHLRVKMAMMPDPWKSQVEEGEYVIETRLYKNQLFGTYSGTFKNKSVSGEVQGIISPHWPQPISNHTPIRPREHPRLVFRRDQLPALREKAKTAAGQAILARLKTALAQKIYYDGYVPTGGYHAAGYCFLSLLNDDPQEAETAWQIVNNSINQPAPRLLEKSPVVAGVALAYDLCYDTWNLERQKRVTRWLAGQARWLVNGDTPRRGWNSNPQSNWNARARGAAGLAALAILEEPTEFLEKPADAYRLLKIAERNVQRYLMIGIGDRGFGTEGDHYTTEPWVLSILPFLQAYQNVMGEDVIQGSGAAWFLPHYVMRMVGNGGEVALPTYGRHRLGPGGSLFAIGLGTVPEEFLPGVMWFFSRHWGRDGNKSFGVELPHEAVFALAGYQDDVISKNPAQIWGRVLVDEQKGFYVFRNQWQDENDFVASIYLKRETPRGGHWSFPDAGSFRIWGLGGQWANVGSSNGKQEDENVVLNPEKQAGKGAKLTFFQQSPDGSGVVSLQRYNWQRSFAVDYSGASGVPGLFVVVDNFVGEKEVQDKTWVMHTQGKVTVEGQRFTIQAASGATMQGTFITPEKVQIGFEKAEKGGVLRASGSGRFFVIMTVQNGAVPNVEVLGTGLDTQVKVGGQQIEVIDNNIVFKSLTAK